jgi:uncharacterized protein
LCATVAYCAITLVAAVIIGVLITLVFTDASIDDLTDRDWTVAGLIGSSLWQVLLIAGVWFAAGLWGGPRQDVLQIDQPLPGRREIAAAIAGLVLVQVALQAPLYLYDSEWVLANYRLDIEPYLVAARDPSARFLIPVVAVTAIVLAPLGEEFMFRGFLLSGLAKGRWGFWIPAILSTVLWTALHAYTVTGTLAVMAYGLYFSWLLWRTGRLWLSLICHAFANVWAMATVAYIAWG